MKNLYYSSILFFSSLTIANAQQVVQATGGAAQGTTPAEKVIQQTFSASDARKSVVMYLKKSLSGINDKQKTSLSKNIDSLLITHDVVSKQTYPLYIEQVNKVYAQEEKLVGVNAIDNVAKLNQSSIFKKSYSFQKSAECFAESEQTSFVQAIDAEGNEIIAFQLEPLMSNPRYGLVDSYTQGFARIKKDMVYGFLNLCGEEAIPAQYDYAENFNDGRALVKKYFWFFVDADGTESKVLENVVDARALKYGVSVVKFKDNKFALIDNNFDKTRKTLSPYYEEVQPFVDDLLQVRNGKMYGLIKVDGSNVTDVAYENIYLSDNEQWIVIEQDKKVGLIDRDGNTRIKPSYESIKTISVNTELSSAVIAVAKDASGYRIIELNERKLSDVYASIGTFNTFGLAQACKVNLDKTQKCGYVNYEGTEIIPSIYDEVSPFNNYGMAVASQKLTNCSAPVGNCTADVVYDYFGRITIDKINPSSPVGVRYAVTDTLMANILVAIRTTTPDGKGKEIEGYNLVDKVSFKRFTKEPYALIRRFDKQYFAIKKNELWGLLDNQGNEALAPSYKELLHSSEGLFGVMYDNERFGFIDKTGKVRITFEYSEINPFQNGLAIVAQGKGKYGIINKFNAKIAPCTFKSIITTADGQYEIIDNSSNKYVLNKGGDCVSANAKDFYEIVRKANKR